MSILFDPTQMLSAAFNSQSKDLPQQQEFINSLQSLLGPQIFNIDGIYPSWKKTQHAPRRPISPKHHHRHHHNSPNNENASFIQTSPTKRSKVCENLSIIPATKVLTPLPDIIIPAINLAETPDKIQVLVSLPGTTNDKINVDYNKDDHLLTIDGIIPSQEHNDKVLEFHLNEIKTGKFAKKLEFKSVSIDHNNVIADYENGILEVILPKLKTEEVEAITMEETKEQEKPMGEVKRLSKVRRIPVVWED